MLIAHIDSGWYLILLSKFNLQNIGAVCINLVYSSDDNIICVAGLLLCAEIPLFADKGSKISKNLFTSLCTFLQQKYCLDDLPDEQKLLVARIISHLSFA